MINVFSLFFLFDLLASTGTIPDSEPAGHTGVTAHFGHMVAEEDCWPTAETSVFFSRRHQNPNHTNEFFDSNLTDSQTDHPIKAKLYSDLS